MSEQRPFPILHIVGQAFQHCDAMIIGNRAALLALQDAIGWALATGSHRHEFQAFVSDGEGYEIRVLCDDSDWQGEQWQSRSLPYQTDP